MYRVEDKYQLNSLDMFFLESKIASIMETDSFSVNGGYTISSIYFDDIFDTCLNDVVNGIDIRTKYRIRIYNNSFNTIKLEIKHKKHGFIYKEGCLISKDEMDALLMGQCIRQADSGTNNNVIQQFNYAINTMGLRPQIVIIYERRAFVCESGNVRITFDRNISSCDRIDLLGNKDLVSESINIVEGNDSILEVKYDELLPSYISEVLEMGTMMQVSCSKYQLGREAVKCQ